VIFRRRRPSGMLQDAGGSSEGGTTNLRRAFDRIGDGLRTGGTYWMLVGSLAAAVGAYLFQAIGTRALGQVRYAPIGTLWTIQYLTVSIVLYSVETYVVRGSIRAGSKGSSLAKIWGWLVIVAVGLSLFSWVFRDRLFQGQGALAPVAGAIVLAYGAFMIVRGRLAGSGRFKAYGLVTASESLSRFVAAAAGAAIAASTLLFAWVMPLGALAAASWWPLLKRRRPESPARPVRAEPAGTLRFLVLTTSANAMTQLLLAGGPLLLAFLHARPAEISVFFVTVTAARLPLVFVFGGILSRLLRTFVRLADMNEGRSLRRVTSGIAIGTAATAAVGGAAAAAIGPQVIGLLFGHGFVPQWWVGSGATCGVLLATGSMILNQVLVATGSERRLPWPWSVALIGSGLAIAATGGTPLARVMAGFIIGEAVALVGLALATSYRQPNRVLPAAASNSEVMGSEAPLNPE
jgi:O-antigen/teichoic acid export membrane protein